MIADASLERLLPRRTVALVGDLVRASLWGTAGVAWIVFAQIYARMWRLTLADPAHSDFTIFYYTVRLVRDGLPMYGASPARYGIRWAADHLGNLNPPHFQLLIAPLGLLSYEWAFAVWTAVCSSALAASILVVSRTLQIQITRRRVVGWGALIISSAPFTTVAVTSELTFLLMLPFTLAWAAARRGRWRTAGLWLGVCISFKLFFALFIPWLLMRRCWPAIVGVGAAAFAAVAIGTLAFGAVVYREWVSSLGAVGWWWLPMNASWHGFISRCLLGSESVEPLIRIAALVAPFAVAGSVVFCATTLHATQRLGRDGREIDLAFVLLLLGAILGSPLGWVYYLPLALGPLVGVLWHGTWRSLSGPVLASVALMGAGFYVPQEEAASGQPSALMTLTVASAYFWSSAAVWAGAVMLSRRVVAS
jgi:uncharacterized membrane protein